MRQSLKRIHQHPLYFRIQEILETFRHAGEEAVLAGGCVRDALMDRVPKDFDIATSALPEKTEALFPRTLAVGKEFGTIVVVFNEGSFEVTTFRRDRDYIDGRRPTGVVFSNSEEDARRRDFTINGLFYDPLSEQVDDFVGGLADLRAGRVRAIGDAEHRFAEDRLRLLRAIRFRSQLGFEIEPGTWDAIQMHASAIGAVSAERIYQEMIKLMEGRFRVWGLASLVESGLAKTVWPELSSTSPAYGVFQRTLEALPFDVRAGVVLALWVLSGDAETSLGPMLERLQSWKSPRALREQVRGLVEVDVLLWSPKTRPAERLRVWARDDLELLMDLQVARCLSLDGNLRRLDQWIDEYLKTCDTSGELPKPFMNGEDLLRMGFVPGPRLGEVLQLIYDDQLEGRIQSINQARSLAERHLRGTSKRGEGPL